jgi:hypothetical protein
LLQTLSTSETFLLRDNSSQHPRRWPSSVSIFLVFSSYFHYKLCDAVYYCYYTTLVLIIITPISSFYLQCLGVYFYCGEL